MLPIIGGMGVGGVVVVVAVVVVVDAEAAFSTIQSSAQPEPVPARIDISDGIVCMRALQFRQGSLSFMPAIGPSLVMYGMFRNTDVNTARERTSPPPKSLVALTIAGSGRVSPQSPYSW